MGAIVFDPKQSELLRALLSHLEMIALRLGDDSAWQGFRVTDATNVSERLICRDRLHPSDNSKTFLVSAHAFAGGGAGELHDHRWPLAVYPVGAGAKAGEPLYDMPWEHGAERGTLVVKAREPYAIDDTNVRHAVVSRRSHASVVLVDVTNPPTRDNRLATEAMDAAAIRAALRTVRDAFGR